MGFNSAFKGLKAELNATCHLLALLGAHHILHFSRIRVKTEWTYAIFPHMISCRAHRRLCLPSAIRELWNISVHERNAVRFGIPEDIENIFPLYHFRRVLGSISILSQSASGHVILGIKRQEREAQYMSQFTAEFKITCNITSDLPIPVAARSKAWVCGRPLDEIVGSNPTWGMDVCRECCVLSGRCLSATS